MFRQFLFPIFVLCSALFAKTIEYGGIAFDCDAGCAFPDYDYQALLGRIPKNLRAAKYELIQQNLKFHFFFNSNPMEFNRALLNQAVDQLRVKAFYENRPYPDPLPQDDTYVFRRKEAPVISLR